MMNSRQRAGRGIVSHESGITTRKKTAKVNVGKSTAGGRDDIPGGGRSRHHAMLAGMPDDARFLRESDDELRRGFAVMSDIGPAVSVFGSARAIRGDPLYERARRTARALGEQGYTIVTGGGPGVMEAANLGAREAGAV